LKKIKKNSKSLISIYKLYWYLQNWTFS